MKHLTKRLDWLTTLVPFLCILFLCILFIAFPEDSSSVLGSIRFFLGDQFGSFYLLMGLGALFCSLYAAFSRFGSIRLGGKSPRYSNLQWGSMMFTAGLAARYPVLFPLRVDALCGRTSYLRYGFCAGLGLCLPAVSLGTDPVEFLYHFSCCLWLYAPCPETEPSEILRSLPSCFGKAGRWSFGTHH